MKSLILFLIPVLFLVGCQGSSSSSSASFADIKPPFTTVEVPTDTATIDPALEQVVNFHNGVTAEIPANAFVDEKGKVVTGPVTLAVEKYDTRAKILASGIPMTYDEGGKKQDMESAGMFSIEGYAGDTKVGIAADKKITINYSSTVQGNYDFFYLEEQPGMELKTGGFAPGANSKSPRQGRWKKLSTDAPAEVYDTSKTVKNFRLKFASKDYPELASLQNVNWRLATTFKDPATDANKWALEKEWTSLDISKPKYISGDPVFTFPFLGWQDTSIKDYDKHDEVYFTDDLQHMVIQRTLEHKLTIWSVKGGRTAVINNVSDLYRPVTLLGNDYLLITMGKDLHSFLYNIKGELIANFGKSMWHNVLLDKDRAAFDYSASDDLLHPSIRLTDLHGHVIKEWNNGDGANYHGTMFFRLSERNLVIISDSSISVFDLNGNLVKKLHGEFSNFDDMDGDKLLCADKSGRLLVWDYSTDQKFQSRQGDFNAGEKIIDGSTHYAHFSSISGTPFVQVTEAGTEFKGPTAMWNYQTGEVTRLNFAFCAIRSDGLSEIIAGLSEVNDSPTFHLYNLNKKKELIAIPGLFQSWEGGLCAEVSRKWQRILINSHSHPRLFDISGKLIRNFKTYDSMICYAGYADSNTIFTYSENGIYRLWDMNGRLLSSKPIENGQNSFGYLWQKKLIVWGNIFRSYRVFDVNADLLIDAGRQPMGILGKNEYMVSVARDKMGEITPFSIRQKNVYQLTLRTLKDEFQTYIYLDKATADLLSAYATFKTQKLNEEVKRSKQEMGLVRSFAIAKFGIYNWDMFVLDTNRIDFAADFQFGVPTEYSNISVFLVTKVNGNAVIKVPYETWSHFLLNPSVPNRLIAVLPGNKIAVVTEEEMKKIDWAAVKQTHKCTITFKTIDKPVASITDLNEYL